MRLPVSFSLKLYAIKKKKSFFQSCSRGDQREYEFVHIVGDLRVPTRIEVTPPPSRSRRPKGKFRDRCEPIRMLRLALLGNSRCWCVLARTRNTEPPIMRFLQPDILPQGPCRLQLRNLLLFCFPRNEVYIQKMGHLFMLFSYGLSNRKEMTTKWGCV